jgi:hypothetical protein
LRIQTLGKPEGFLFQALPSTYRPTRQMKVHYLAVPKTKAGSYIPGLGFIAVD